MSTKRSLDRDIEGIVHRRYLRILFADFTADTMSSIDVEDQDGFGLVEERTSQRISEAFAEFADGPLLDEEDKIRFREFTSIKRIKEKLSVNPRKSMCISYQRRFTPEEEKFHTINMEIFPDIDENGHNVGYIFVKDMTSEINSYVKSMEARSRLSNRKQLNGTRSVLIVDDDEITRAIAVKIISEKFNTFTAENGLEALKVLENNPEINLVLLDVHMPVMDGHRFLHEKMQIPPIASIPVIVATSDAGTEEEVRCLSLGATDVTAKPFNREVLLSRIESIIRLHESSVALSAVEHDHLTGIYTRSAFFHYSERMLLQNKDRDFDITIADIDKFRYINQKYGLETGDAVLRIVSDVLRKYLHDDNIILGRYGADQFAILGPSNLRAAYAEKDNVVFEIERKLKKSGIDETVKVIIKRGIYEHVDKSLPLSEMCDRAVIALKSVKPDYGNKVVFFDEKMLAELNNTHMIEESMQGALRRKQFKIYYQPKHDAKTGKLVGAEALVRWLHPDMGFMNPGLFIPLFERNGFISKLDQYVFKTVCQDISAWKSQETEPVPVSVNISRRDLLIKNDEGLLAKYAEMADVDNKYIHVEITESAYVAEEEWLIERIGRLRDQGFKIEMDDFGSGYSALGMIKTMPLDIIKLDMSFIKHLDEQIEVVKVMIDLAHVLGKTVTAEGVETEEQLNTLKELGCDTIQGYCYSKPLTFEEFTNYLKQYQ